MPKMTFFTQGREGENLQFFQLSKKPFKMMKTTTSWPQDTWKVNICSFGWEISENVKCPKMTILSQVRGHEKLQFFRLSGKSLKLMKTTTSWPQDTWKVNICPLGWEICKFVKCPKWHFSQRARVGENFNFFNFPKSLLKWWKQHQLSTGHLKSKYLLIWVWNKWKCEMPQNDIFLAGPRSWKTSIFSIFWKVFRTDENHHQLTTGHLKYKYLPIWMRNMQICEMPKMTFFTPGRGGGKLQFFQLSKKPFKMMKTTTSCPLDTWKVNICSFGWEISENVKCPKNGNFLAGPQSWKTLIFLTFWKVFKTDENHHQLTTGHLQYKYLPIWMRNMQICEMPKMTFFTQGRGGGKLQFFSTFQKAF